MNYSVEFNLGGGLFSYYLIILSNLDRWVKENKITINDNVCFDSRYDTGSGLKTLPPNRSGMSGCDYNVFDYLFDQKNNVVDKTIICEYPHIECRLENILSMCERYKYISKNLIKINQNIINKVNEFKDDFFKGTMLGIHVRMTDMNLFAHGHNTKIVTEDDYFRVIDDVIMKHSIDGIFVASDNEEMLEKLSLKYNISYCKMSHRQKKQIINKEQFINEQIPNGKPNYFSPDYYIESFMDSILLSYCNIIIGRKSSLGYSSLTYDWNNIEKYYSLDES